MASVESEVGQVRALLNEYPWLKSREKYDAASKVAQLSSVEQAHNLAVSFNAIGDSLSAREALRQIVIKELPGSAVGFHNAHVEAMDMQEVQLALEIDEAALRSSPYQYDLVADKVITLRSLGRADEARRWIEEWRTQQPEEFFRSWRPVVFYVELFKQLEMTPDALTSIRSALQEAIKRLPYEVKPWSTYIQFLEEQGDQKGAEESARHALELNPLSQELNYILGELLLRQGKAKEASDYLTRALGRDFQDQFQHDVNQFAVRGSLAQAYEALGEPEKAKLFYESIVRSSDPDAFGKMKVYAQNRLAAIALLAGELPGKESDASPEQKLQALHELAQLLSSQSEGADQADESLGDSKRD